MNTLPHAVQNLRVYTLTIILASVVSMLVMAENPTGEYKITPDNNTRNSFPPGWDFQSNSENPHAIIVVLGANPRINDIPLQPGDYIGAFYEDDYGELKCGGADVWDGNENIIFAVFGNDSETPEKDGFSYNETMHFKVYYQDNNKAYDVTSTTWDPEYFSIDKWLPLGLSACTDMYCEIDFDAYATFDNNPLCIGQTVNLEGHIFIGTTGNYTWQWSSLPAGLSSNEQSASHTPAETTTYTLEVSDGLITSVHELVVGVNENPTVDAGEDATICIDHSTTVEAVAENASGFIWSTSGDGTFDDLSASVATYYPGENDKQNLGVELMVTALPLDPCEMQAIDNMTIHMTTYPEIAVEESLSFCKIQDIIVEAEADLYENVAWLSSGDGTFSAPDELTTQYFPGPSDFISNEFALTAFVSAVAPCEGTVSGQVLITLQDGATLNAPTSKTACSNSPVNLNSLAYNYSTSLWETQGDGTFQEPSTLNTVYYPGPEDISNNGTTVSISAFGNDLCTGFATTKDITIILTPLPEVEAGPDTEGCHGSPVTVQGSTANTSFFSWGTMGDGYFDNPYTESPNYYPGTLDNTAGTAKLFLTGYAVYPCTAPATDSVLVSILPDAFIEIGANTGDVCYDDSYSFVETEATNYSSISWFTINGNGVFDDPSGVTPTYTPDPEYDYPLGSVIIGVTVMPIEPCTLSSDDFFTLHFQPPPTADAGAPDTLVQGDSFLTAPTIENFSAVLWETTGDGTFSDPASISPAYFPGESDIKNYGTTLMVTAFPNQACETAATDFVSIFIYKSQQIVMMEGENGFSSYIDYEDKTFEQVIEPLGDDLVFAQKFGQVYWPEFGINTIADFQNSSGVKLILNNDRNLQFTGFEVNEKTINLNPGWNIIPVLSSCPVNSQIVSSLVGTSLIIITEVDGNGFFMPGHTGNTLEQLVPGKAYMMKVTSGSTFSFPDCD